MTFTHSQNPLFHSMTHEATTYTMFRLMLKELFSVMSVHHAQKRYPFKLHIHSPLFQIYFIINLSLVITVICQHHAGELQSSCKNIHTTMTLTAPLLPSSALQCVYFVTERKAQGTSLHLHLKVSLSDVGGNCVFFNSILLQRFSNLFSLPSKE